MSFKSENSPADEIADGLRPIVVGVENPNVLLDETAHKRVLAKVDIVFEDPVDDGGKESSD